MGPHATGVETFTRFVGKATHNVERAIVESLEICGGVILRKANYYVPKDTLALMNSGRYVVTGKGNHARLAVIYGRGTDGLGEAASQGSNVAEEYALYVHEDLTKKHEAPTQAKFLERGERETRGTCTSVIRRTLETAIRYAKDGKSV